MSEQPTTLIVNLFGGPGCGKSTTAAGVFYLMKMSGINCELATEAAKDFTWEKRFHTLENQAYVFAKQLQKLHRLIGQVDVVITDSPLPLSSIYAPENYPKSFDHFVLDIFNSMNNLNICIRRCHNYESSGRKETEDQANLIDSRIREYLVNHTLSFIDVNGDPSALALILGEVEKSLAKKLDNPE